MRKTWLIFSQAVTVLLAVFFVVLTLKPEWLRSPQTTLHSPSMQAVPPVPVLPPVVPQPSLQHLGYSVAAKRASPAVVSITASKAPPRNRRNEDPFFEFFFGGRGTPYPQEPQVGLGSGVIVSQQGYLLTNNHVIEGADDIQVLLADGRQARAKVVGTDPETDVAVLQIALDRLPVIEFGNVDQTQVGDVVLAIGNPFGVGQTVTSGIVSALGRNQLGINTFENFIQTDAAINPGNSGGALVDAQGHLLGINTAIYSRTGGSLGIGFAIPVNTARQVLDSLIKDGQVTRGWIGVEPRELTPDIAQTLQLPVQEGVLITAVMASGPAGAGGLKPGDVVVRIGDTPVANNTQLLNAVAALKPKAVVPFSVQRGNKVLELNITIAQRPPRNVPQR
jgi:serine protease DegQ